MPGLVSNQGSGARRLARLGLATGAAAIVATAVAVPVVVLARRGGGTSSAGANGSPTVAAASPTDAAGASTALAAAGGQATSLTPTAAASTSDEDALWAAIHRTYPDVNFVTDCQQFVPTATQPLCAQAGGWSPEQLATGLASVKRIVAPSGPMVLFGRKADGTWGYLVMITNGHSGPPYVYPLAGLVCAGGDGMNLRAEPSTTATVATLIPDGTTVRPDQFVLTKDGAPVTETAAELVGDGWYHISSPQDGWASAPLLEPLSNPKCIPWTPSATSYDGTYALTMSTADAGCGGPYSIAGQTLTIVGATATLTTAPGAVLSGTATVSSGTINVHLANANDTWRVDITGTLDPSGNLAGGARNGGVYPGTQNGFSCNGAVTGVRGSAADAAPSSCPDAATLLGVWNASGLADFYVPAFTNVSCWHSWVAAAPTTDPTGYIAFATSPALHVAAGAELQSFYREVCSSPSAPAGWKTNPHHPC